MTTPAGNRPAEPKVLHEWLGHRVTVRFDDDIPLLQHGGYLPDVWYDIHGTRGAAVEIARLVAELARTKEENERLRQYVDHDSDCDCITTQEAACSCGLAALSANRKARSSSGYGCC